MHKHDKQKHIKSISESVCVLVVVLCTVYSLQFIVPEDEREQFDRGAYAKCWRPLKAVVA